MTGRFLEISVQSDDVLASLQFYESLGFCTVAGETWPHPYAVITDGRLYLGLHQQSLPSPTLTFVQPELRAHAAALRSQFAVEYERLGTDEFHEIGCRDPDGGPVRLLEARTFSPPPLAAGFASSCGYFMELSLLTRAPDAARHFWEQLGFVALDEEPAPFKRLPLTSAHLNIGLHGSRALRRPVLLFESQDMQERLASLRERGFTIGDEMPEALDEHCNGVLTAPEGTRLLLTQSAA